MIDDWDGEGGIAAQESAANRAIRIVQEVARQVGESFVVPAVVASGDGGIDLTWTLLTGRRILLLIPSKDDQVVLVDALAGITPTRSQLPFTAAISRIALAISETAG